MPKKLESSTTTTKKSGHKLDQSQAMVPKETVEMLVHPEPRNTHTAPQQSVKQILVQLNKHVLQESKNCTTPHTYTTHVQSKIWHTICQYLNTNVPDIDDHTVDQIIATGTTPLLECIINHYNRMVNKHHQQTFTIMNNTHHTLHSDPTNVSIQMATTMTLESIGDLIDHLKQKHSNNYT